MSARALCTLSACAILAGLVAPLGACTDKAGLTQVVVVVDSDLMAPSEIDRVTLDVAGLAQDRSATADLAMRELPRSVGLVHDGGPLGPVTVTAKAWLGATPVIEREAEFFFESGRSLFLPLELMRSCVGVPCGDGMTCVAGACAPRAAGILAPFQGRPQSVGIDEPSSGAGAAGDGAAGSAAGTS